MNNTRMKQYKSSKKNQKGMTLIEAVVSLIVIILIVAAASGRIGSVFGKNETADEVTNINSLIVGTKTLKGNSGYGTAGVDLVPQLIATESAPKGMPVVAAKLKNSWNSDVAVASTGLGFTITTPGVPKAACIELANKVSRGGAVTTKVGAATAVTGEYPIATATTDCASATANSIVFTVLN